jgi:hypothetical protein
MKFIRSSCSHVSGGSGNTSDQSDMVKMVGYTIEAKIQAVIYVNSIQPRYTYNNGGDPFRLWGSLQTMHSCLSVVNRQHNECSGVVLFGVVGDSTNRKLGTGTWETRHFSEHATGKHNHAWNWSGVGYVHSSSESTNHRGAKGHNFNRVSVIRGHVLLMGNPSLIGRWLKPRGEPERCNLKRKLDCNGSNEPTGDVDPSICCEDVTIERLSVSRMREIRTYGLTRGGWCKSSLLLSLNLWVIQQRKNHT